MGDSTTINEGSPVSLAGEWNIGNAEELHQLLTQALERGPDVTLDLAGVTACDTAALQLLCSLRKTAIERGQRFSIAALSPAIVEIAAALGLPLSELMEGAGDGL